MFRIWSSSVNRKISSLVLLCICVAVVVVGFVSYSYLKDEELSQLDTVHQTIQNGLEVYAPQVESVIQKAKSGTLDVKTDSDLKQVEAYLTSMTKSKNAASVYILYPDVIEQKKDDGVHELTKFVALSDNLKGYGYYAQTDFDLPMLFVDAMNKVKSSPKPDYLVRTSAYNDGDGDWMSVLAKYKDSKGNYIADFCIDFSLSEINANMHSLLMKIVWLGVIVVVLSSVLMWWLIRSQLSPLGKIRNSLAFASHGDFTQKMQIKRKDEFGLLGHAFDDMLDSVVVLLKSVKNSANLTLESSQTLKGAAQASLVQSEEVSKSADQIAVSSMNQTKSTEETARALEEMAASIQRIAESSTVLSERVSSVSASTGQSKELMSETVETINEVRDRMNNLLGDLQAMRSNSSSISSITEVISDIANRTNLLSLNASIEAARAGEHGRGFAVVATEIRNLSAQSKESSDRIAESIKTILEGIEVSYDSIVKATETVESAVDIIDSANRNIDEINSAAVDVTQEVQEISASTEELSASSEEILATVENLSNLASHIDSMSKAIASAAQQQSKSSAEVAASSSGLLDSSQVVSDELDKFKV